MRSQAAFPGIVTEYSNASSTVSFPSWREQVRKAYVCTGQHTGHTAVRGSLSSAKLSSSRFLASPTVPIITQNLHFECFGPLSNLIANGAHANNTHNGP